MTDFCRRTSTFAQFPVRDGESAPQICLAAGVRRGTDQDILPSLGVAGDMVAFTRRRGDNVQAELWFCTQNQRRRQRRVVGKGSTRADRHRDLTQSTDQRLTSAAG